MYAPHRQAIDGLLTGWGRSSARSMSCTQFPRGPGPPLADQLARRPCDSCGLPERVRRRVRPPLSPRASRTAGRNSREQRLPRRGGERTRRISGSLRIPHPNLDAVEAEGDVDADVAATGARRPAPRAERGCRHDAAPLPRKDARRSRRGTRLLSSDVQAAARRAGTSAQCGFSHRHVKAHGLISSPGTSVINFSIICLAEGARSPVLAAHPEPSGRDVRSRPVSR